MKTISIQQKQILPGRNKLGSSTIEDILITNGNLEQLLLE
jgi:hypothetical protein